MQVWGFVEGKEGLMDRLKEICTVGRIKIRREAITETQKITKRGKIFDTTLVLLSHFVKTAQERSCSF